MSESAPERSVRTVTSKVLDILAAFEVPQPSLSLTQIAQAADLPLPTAHRLVAELVSWGALSKHPSGNYAVGLRLWAVGENSLRGARGAARAHLQDLFDVSRETTQLAVRSNFDALYLDRIYSTRRLPRSTRVGGHVPLHLAAVGKVLLANESPEFIEAYLSGDLETRTHFSHTNPSRLRTELAQVRDQGWAISIEELRLGSCSIAVPVVPERGLMPAALGLVLKSSHSELLTNHLSALRNTAQRLAGLAL